MRKSLILVTCFSLLVVLGGPRTPAEAQGPECVYRCNLCPPNASHCNLVCNWTGRCGGLHTLMSICTTQQGLPGWLIYDGLLECRWVEGDTPGYDWNFENDVAPYLVPPIKTAERACEKLSGGTFSFFQFEDCEGGKDCVGWMCEGAVP